VGDGGDLAAGSTTVSRVGTAAERLSVGGVLPRHHLVAYVHVVALGAASRPLLLQPGECDAACWVPLRHMRSLLRGKDETAAGWGGARSYAMAAGTASGRVAAERLRGVYPNPVGEGIGRGHCFALETLLSLGEEGGDGGAAADDSAS